MKKILIAVSGISMFVATANAQPFKQAGGENNLQLSFAPLGNTPISLSNGILTYRKFDATGTAAYRLGFSIGSNKITNIIQQADDTLNFADSTTVGFPGAGGYTLVQGRNPEGKDVLSTFTFSIRPGYEKHFAGTDRLSPYVGAELIFAITNTKKETDQITDADYTATFIDSTQKIYVQDPWTAYTLNTKGGSTTFGLNLIAGFDFYFTKNLSIGAELNFGYSMTKFKDEKTEMLDTKFTSTSIPLANGQQQTTITNSNKVVSASDQAKGKSSGFGPGVLTAIKIGWLF